MQRRPIAETLADVRAGLARVTPAEALTALGDGGLLIDVRTTEQRTGDGVVPGAMVVPLNVLEWRFDPAEPASLPEAGDFDQVLIVLCDEGYCSSLAAGRLQDLGYRHATDVDGGFAAWKRAGLPVETA